VKSLTRLGFDPSAFARFRHASRFAAKLRLFLEHPPGKPGGAVNPPLTSGGERCAAPPRYGECGHFVLFGCLRQRLFGEAMPSAELLLRMTA